ncbi:hypothetical protein PG5_01480 [Pseudomonas sp. G5(2012)]|nr:hypothetical protein PG5_01480 [Pseudomonas sp. G5(2012)]
MMGVSLSGSEVQVNLMKFRLIKQCYKYWNDTVLKFQYPASKVYVELA